FSGGRLVETAENIHECRFAAAAGSHDGDKIAGTNIETNAAQRVDASLSEFVILVQIFHGNDGVRERRGADRTGMRGVGRIHARILSGAAFPGPDSSGTRSESPGHRSHSAVP